MKLWEDFKKDFDKLKPYSKLSSKDFDEMVKRKYKELADKRFSIWLSQYSADYINNTGYDLLRNIFDAMDDIDK